MRWFSIALVVCIPAVAAAKSSNPAFLGVGMSDLPTYPGSTPAANTCQIETITQTSGADKAGIQQGDIILTVDGAAVANCNALVAEIQKHESCDVVKIEVRRVGSTATALSAKLCSRADVLREKFVGQHVPIAPLTRVEDKADDSLAASGKTTIVGWFDQRSCVGCDRVFSKLNQWARKKSTKQNQIRVVATTGAREHNVEASVEALRPYQRTLDVPLMVTDSDTFTDFAISDGERIHFMVIDAAGIVQYVTPLVPDADDQPAVLDELFAAVEQAAYHNR